MSIVDLVSDLISWLRSCRVLDAEIGGMTDPATGCASTGHWGRRRQSRGFFLAPVFSVVADALEPGEPATVMGIAVVGEHERLAGFTVDHTTNRLVLKRLLESLSGAGTPKICHEDLTQTSKFRRTS